jgi:hypothetical protein
VSVLRSLLYLAVSALVSWHLLLRPPVDAPIQPTPVKRVELAVAPEVEQPAPPEPEQQPEAIPPPPPPPPAPPTETAPEAAEPTETVEEIPDPEPTPTPPPAEAGAPEGDEEEERTEPVPEQKPIATAERIRAEIENIASSERLVEEAHEELAGRTRRGFTTEFDTATADQLAIARFFGEQVLLIPRKGLDPRNHHYFLIDAAQSFDTRRVNAAPPGDIRQVRDLLDRDIRYASLPHPLKTLRRQVTLASEIYLFAAPIPPREWAIVMARRAAALERCNVELGGPERTLEDLRRVKMRYVPLKGGVFDIQVKEFVFADGARWTQNT